MCVCCSTSSGHCCLSDAVSRYFCSPSHVAALFIQATCLLSLWPALSTWLLACALQMRAVFLHISVCIRVHVLFHLTISSSATEHRFYFLICNCRKGALGTELFVFSFSLVLCAASLWSLLHCLQTEQKKAVEGVFLLLCRRWWGLGAERSRLKYSLGTRGLEPKLCYVIVSLIVCLVPHKAMPHAQAQGPSQQDSQASAAAWELQCVFPCQA